MIRSLRPLPLAACFLLLTLAAARADDVRVVSSDARGVTLRLTIGDWRLAPEGTDGRLLPYADDLPRIGVAGHARLPYGHTLVVLPPGARASARVIASGTVDSREGVRLAIAATSKLAPDAKFGFIPVLEPADPIRDGIWPPQQVVVGEPASMRDRQIVPVEIYPFQYDEAARRLTVTQSLTVRVDFAGGVGAAPGLSEVPDAHDEALFGSRIANWSQARPWRSPRPKLADGGVFGRRAILSRAMASGPSVAAFDENMPEVRVRIDTTGVYAVDFDTLATYGYPPGVPIAEVSIHRHEFIQDATVPYATYELPIEVDDFDNNGVFDSGDRVVFWTWDWAQRSRASQAQRCWGDAEVVYVTAMLSGQQGLRIAHRSGWRSRTDLTPLTSYPWRQRFKQNLQYMTFPPDTIVDPFLWTNISIYAAPDVFPFEVNNIDATMASTMTVNWQGVGGTQHINWATVTNRLGQTTTVVDSVVWIGLQYFPRTGAIPPGGLTEGNTNTLKVWGKTDNTPTGSSVTVAGVHSFDLTYWRSYVPLLGYLRCNSGSQTSAYEIRSGPFTDAPSIRAYDVTDSLNPVRLDNITFETQSFNVFAHVQDSTTVGVQRQYVICEIPRSPSPGAMSRVTRHRVF